MSELRNEPPPPTPLSPQQVIDWLDFDCQPLTDRSVELISALRRFLQAHAPIETEESQGKAADLREQIRAFHKSVESRRGEAKGPFLAAGRAVDAWFAGKATPFERPLSELIERMTTFAVAREQAQRRAALEEAERARALADRKAHDAADALTRAPEEVEEKIAVAAAAEQMAQGAEQMAAATTSDLSRVRGEFGGVASLKRKWKWREVNRELIPRRLMEVDSAKVNAEIKLAGRDANGVPRARIPGIEIYEVKTV